jgi:hypothetical protein
MNDQTIQRKLNQLRKIANELGEEAVRRYGPEGNLFFEAEGFFHLMDGDEEGRCADRQAHVRFTSEGVCSMGSGAW